MSKFMNIIWVMSSYAPLWFILFVQELPINDMRKIIKKYSETGEIRHIKMPNMLLPIIFILLSVLPTLFILRYIKKKNKKVSEGISVKIQEYELDNNLSLDYLSTYILALIGVNFQDINSILTGVVTLIFFAILYIRHQQIKYNPTMELIGYRVYLIKYTKSNMRGGVEPLVEECVLITRKKKGNLIKDDIEIVKLGGKKEERVYTSF